MRVHLYKNRHVKRGREENKNEVCLFCCIYIYILQSGTVELEKLHVPSYKVKECTIETSVHYREVGILCSDITRR